MVERWLACSHKIVDGDVVEPLRNHKVQRDLKVARDVGRDLKRVRGWIDSLEDIETSSQMGILLSLRSRVTAYYAHHATSGIGSQLFWRGYTWLGF